MTDVTASRLENLDLTLLANFVHQVVNPLNGVAGTLDNLIDGTIQDDRREQRTIAARAQLERCITLVRNLAFLVSDPSAPLQDEVRIVTLPQVIIESAMFYQEEGASRKISILLEDKRTQNKVRAHPELIRQVLMNIFDNCIKYSKFGSQVTVKQWIQSSTNTAIVTVRSEPERPIDSDEMNKIFDLGFRGSNAKEIIASGTGIGLYICKQLVEIKHGGVLSCQNDKNGILFTIRLPKGIPEENGENNR